jgi:GntR family transcriptional repressor for pyruvate dehydrogenase complex
MAARAIAAPPAAHPVPRSAAAPSAAPRADPAWPQFAVVDRSTLSEEIASRLLDLIRAERLHPGDKLPAERELAAAMHVSRPVLREALRALSIMKVVEIRQGAGTYITALEPQQLVSHLDFVFSKDPVALAQVIETRRIVEVGNVRLAAERITPDQVAALEVLLGQLRAAVGDPEAFSTLDIAFHNAVCDAAGNFLLAQFMAIIDTLAKVSRERTGASRATRDRALGDHHAIVEALRAQDADEAARAMHLHLDHVEASLAAATGASGRRPTTAEGAR